MRRKRGREKMTKGWYHEAKKSEWGCGSTQETADASPCNTFTRLPFSAFLWWIDRLSFFMLGKVSQLNKNALVEDCFAWKHYQM
jgi:hypothetical protein